MGSMLSFVGSAIGGWFDAYDIYRSGNDAYNNAKANAELTRKQGEIDAEERNAQARAYDRQALSSLIQANARAESAAEELRAGEISQEKANIEQIKGEREAAKRSRLLAQEIGQQYANYAANGFDVAANPTDTFGAILQSSVTEGQADISTILENANMNKWSYEEEKRTHRRNAVSNLADANSSVFQAQSLADSAADYRQSAKDTLEYAEDYAKQQIKEGKQLKRRSRWNAIGKIASAGFSGASAAYNSSTSTSSSGSSTTSSE